MYDKLIKLIHKLANLAGIEWDNDRLFMIISKELTGEAHLDRMNPEQLNQMLNEIENNPAPFTKKAHYVPGGFKLKSKYEKDQPEFKHFRTNYDYTGENYLDKVERRLKGLSKTLKKKKHHKEVKELDKMIKSVKPKKKK
jgi:hypothetical protein